MRAAALDGAVSPDHVDKVLDLTGRVDLEQIKAYDDILAELSAAAAPAETKKACERIAAHHDPDGAEPDPAADFERRDLSVSQSGGMTCIKGRFDPEGGAAFQAVLDAVMRPPAKDDSRSAGQRRADAMIDLCRATLASGTLSTVHGVRPQIGLLLTPEQLTGLAAGTAAAVYAGGAGGDVGAAAGALDSAAAGALDSALAAATNPLARVAGPLAAPADALAAAGVPPVDKPWLDWVGPVSPATACRIACDSEFFRIVLDPRNGLPLDVGSAYRIVPPWIRKAVLARDRTCRWPGCDAPRAWLDIHHVMPWALYRRTTAEECLALCRWHHVRVHEGQWGLELDARTGQVSITRPDGRPYELGPSRPWTTPTTQVPTTQGPAIPSPATLESTTGGPTIPRRRTPESDATAGRTSIGSSNRSTGSASG
jgi:hypothetical protein